MDTEKVIEALALITEVESSMKDLEKSNDPQLPPPFDAGDASDITAALNKDSNSDVLLDEVLNNEKAKRAAIPTKIEDQLKALYRLLSEEKDKKDGKSNQVVQKYIRSDVDSMRKKKIFFLRSNSHEIPTRSGQAIGRRSIGNPP